MHIIIHIHYMSLHIFISFFPPGRGSQSAMEPAFHPIPKVAPRRALKELGPVKHIVSPNFEHVKWAKQWKEVSSGATCATRDVGARLLAFVGPFRQPE